MSTVSQRCCLVLMLTLAGCAAKPAAARRSMDGNSGFGATHTLEQLAQNEKARSSSKSAFDTGAIPTPPGLEPGILTQRDPADPHAFRSLEDVLAEFAQRDPASTLPSAPVPVDPEAQSEAMKLYAKARNEALDGRNLQAIVDLQKAQKLDPNSPEVIRELAQCYIAENRTSPAVELYDQLLRLEPNDPEALFTVGIAAASRRDFERAISALARLELSDRDLNDSNIALADFTLATALRELGYDRASIDAAATIIDLPAELVSGPNAMRLASVYRQRGEILRMIGDAHCRLGEYQDALNAYAQAGSMPVADPSALHPRIIYANLRLGRPYTAQNEMLAVLQAQPQSISERDVRLCAFLNEHAKPIEPLAKAVKEMYQAHPDESSLVRAAASLVAPDEARNLLKSYVARRPRDLDGVWHLLAWIAQSDADSAAQLAITLASEHPDLAGAYSDRLMIAITPPSAALKAVRRAPASAARAHMEAKLLWKLGGLGEAWSVCEAARQQWPDDRGLALQQIQLAAAMQENALFDRTVASAPNFNDIPGMIGLSQAYRAIGQFQPALDWAKKASDQDPNSVDALIEIARAWTALGASLKDEPDKAAQSRQAIDNAIAFADQAIDHAPQREEAFEVLLLIYGPKGVLADTALYQQTLDRLRGANPQSALYSRYIAQETINQRRFEQALDRLMNLCDNPLDSASLTLAVSTWQLAGKLDTAEDWLNQRLADRPGDPALFEQWVRVELLRSKTDSALKQLETMVHSDPQDIFARRLLETVYRANGQTDSAMELGEQRLLARPQGVRRELELAALYAGAERADSAFERLQWILNHADEANTDEIAGALKVLEHLKGDDSRRDALTLDFVTGTVRKDPAAPLQVYGSALRALARMGAPDDRFVSLAEQASAHAKLGSGATLKDAAEWRELAQALVDDHHPAAAARALRVRLQSSSPLDDAARAILARITLIMDAAADADHPDQANVDHSMALLKSLNDDGKLQRVFDTDEKLTLATAAYETSVFYTLIGSRSGADDLLRRSIQLEPDQPMALNNLGYSLLDSAHSRDDAVQFIERAATLQPDESNILDTVGWLRYKQGRFDDQPAEAGGEKKPGALTLIQQSISKWRVPSPEVLDHLGDVQWRLGHKDAAAEAWEQAVKIVENDTFQKLVTQSLQFDQAQTWQILVIDPRTMYDREYGPILARAKEKLAAVKAGEPPKVAPIFAETHE